MADDLNSYNGANPNGYPSQGAPASSQNQQYLQQNYPSHTYQQQVYQSTAQYSAQPSYTQAAQQTKKKGGAGKTFLAGFLGALLACALAFGGMAAWNTMNISGAQSSGTSVKPAESAVVETDSQGTMSITVKDADPTLAEAVAAKALPSVVCIYVYDEQSSYGYYGYGRSNAGRSSQLVQSALGSGVILTEDGYSLTNYHVSEGADALKVNISGDEVEATIVGSDPSSDLAVIKVDGMSGLTSADIGDSDNLTVGQWVMTIGAPFGLEQSVATGVVSATSRSQIMENTSSDPYSYLYGYSTQSSPTLYPNLIQTDAAINPGNSGGALVDAQGRVIGINTLITSYSGNYSGVGFAIPINYALNIANQIIGGKTPTHAKMGVSLTSVTSSVAARYKLATNSGAYVSAVTSQGAIDSGLKEGDIITAINGKKMTSSTDVTLAVREHNPGDTITVTVNRNGDTIDLTLVLGSDEEDLMAQTSSRDAGDDYDGGFTYEDLIDMLRNR